MVARRLVPLLLVALALVPAVAGQDGGNVVYVTDIEGTVTRGTAIQIEDAIGKAEDAGAPLVIRLDTPGGLVSATLDIDRAVARSEVPVLAYVGPSGAWAQSAGTFIFLMGQPNGMAEDTQIGSAQPITSSGSGGTQNASQKVTNALVEKIRSIADRNDRNPEIAERFITENLNLNATNATERGMSDHVSPSLRAFLEDVDGETVERPSGNTTLDIANAEIVHLDRSLLTQLINIVGNPQVSFVLFLIGIYGTIFGLAAPGTLVPETIGALCLVLGLVGLGLFESGTSGILLILLAGTFFVAEVLTPTHGVLTVAGAVALVLGAIFLIDEPLLSRDFLERFQVVALISAVVSGGMVFAAVGIALRTRDQPTRDEVEGRTARVLTPLDPEGMVSFRGERWKARLEEGTAEEDEIVEVADRDGLKLTVRKTTADEVQPEDDPGSVTSGT